MTARCDPAPVPETEPGWGRVLRAGLARAVLAMLVSLVTCSVLPALWGWTPQVIMSGSMSPRIAAGDVVVTRPMPADSLVRGQVVTVTDPDRPGRTRTHRIVGRDEQDRLVLRGDANRQPDSSHVATSQVHGLAVLRVPYVGRPLVWLEQRRWPALLTALLGLGWCGISLFPRGPTSPSPGSDRGLGPRRRSRRRARVAVLMVGVVGTVAVGSGSAAAVFMNRAASSTSSMKAAASFYPYRDAVLADSPYLFWRFAEGGGSTAVDTSPGTAHPGTYYYSPTFTQPGPLVSELHDTAMNTSNGGATANDRIAGPTKFSVEAWFRTTATTGGRLVGFGNGGTDQPSSITDRQLYLGTNSKVYFGIGSDETVVSSSGGLNDGAWHHVVGTYTSGKNNMRLYVDGDLSDSGRATPLTLNGYWRVGAEQLTGWTYNPGIFFDGTIAEVAIYSSALSATRVEAHYVAGTTP